MKQWLVSGVMLTLGCNAISGIDEYIVAEQVSAADSDARLGAEALSPETETGFADTAETAETGIDDVPVESDATVTDASDTGAGADVPPKCDPPAKSYNGHCYFSLSGTGLSWEDAKKGCEVQSSHLATVTTDGEGTMIETIVSGSDRWIGLRRDVGSPAKDASYKWITGEPAVYKNWSVGEPAGSGDCVRILGGGRWADNDCTTKFVAICERE